MVAGGDRRILRASDADRDAVVALLRHHGAAGRLDVTEISDRISQALEAKTLGQLDALLVDLPADDDARTREALQPRWSEVARSQRALPRILLLGLIDLYVLMLWIAGGERGATLPVLVLIASVVLVVRRLQRVAAREARRRERVLRRGGPGGPLL